MTWQTIAIITLSDAWQYTNPVAGQYFRLSHSFPSFNAVLISQAQQTDPDNDPTQFELWQFVKTYARQEREVLEFEVPPFFTQRRLALRKTQRLAVPWTITIEVWTVPQSDPPITVTFPTASSANTTSVAASTTQVQLVAANANRKGLTIVNKSTGTLTIDLDSDSTTGEPAGFIYADGWWEPPVNYTGEIRGVWSNTNGNCFVTEYS
jgi:hypothetical protein